MKISEGLHLNHAYNVLPASTMANKTKAFKKFASSGKLKDTIKSRRQHQQSRRKFEDKVAQRKKQRGTPKEGEAIDSDEEEEVDERDVKRIGEGGRAGGVAKTVEELFGGNLGGDAEESELEELDEEDGEEGEEEEEGEEDLFADEEAMKRAMKDLEKKDPEFFKYLKENDRDLLEFGGEGKGKEKVSDDDVDMEDEDDEEEDEEEGDEEMVERKKTSVTMKMLRQWQEGMLKVRSRLLHSPAVASAYTGLQQHSLRSLRKALLAFRAAAHMNEEDASEGAGSDTKYSIDSPQVFNKLVVTALKFTPVVVTHHFPYKTLPSGKLFVLRVRAVDLANLNSKLQQPKTPNPSLNRLILSHFSTLLHFIKSLPSAPSSVSSTSDEAGGLLLTAVNESTKMLPWIMGARKHLRAYLKVSISSSSQNLTWLGAAGALVFGRRQRQNCLFPRGS
jgi:nucleolar complex protein 2